MDRGIRTMNSEFIHKKIKSKRPKEGPQMKVMKRVVQVAMAAGLIVLGLGMVQNARAGTADTMTVYVTPTGFNYVVSIASPEVQGYDFTGVPLAATTISTKAITVTNGGNVGEYFAL